MAHSDRRTDKGIYETNLTPLIDVSLVLVVILLVATPLAFQSSAAEVEFTQPEASTEKSSR